MGKKKLINASLLLAIIVGSIQTLFAQQQSLPLNYHHQLYYEKHLNRLDEAPFHSAVKPYLASEVYQFVYPDTCYGLERTAPTSGFKKAVNVMGYEDMIRFDENGFIRPVSIDSVNGEAIEVNQFETKYKPRKFYISANPILRLEVGRDLKNTENTIYYNLRGAEINANIGSKVSIYTAFTENQAAFPDYVRINVLKTRAAPGEGRVRNFGSRGFDFSRAVGHITYAPNKYFNAQLGHGKHFIGDGFRSLFLSDNSFVYPYIRLSTQFWKIKYVSIYSEFINDVQQQTDFTLGLPRKLGSFNYLSLDATKWLQLGVFEGMVWRSSTSDGRRTFDANFLNPIIGIRALQKNLDANSVYGINAKITLPNYIILYGQLMVNELSGGLLTAGNRSGFQAGAKYYDAFGVKNLNLLAEYNRVRPYTYQNNGDTVLHYSHYNQALAHPMGANFDEFLFVVNYRYKRLVAELKINAGVSAIDAPSALSVIDNNVGSDILLNAADANPNYADKTKVGQGDFGYKLVNAEARLGYIINPKLNMMIEAKVNVRNYKFDVNIPALSNTDMSLVSVGFNTRLFNHYYDTPVNF